MLGLDVAAVWYLRYFPNRAMVQKSRRSLLPIEFIPVSMSDDEKYIFCDWRLNRESNVLLSDEIIRVPGNKNLNPNGVVNCRSSTKICQLISRRTSMRFTVKHKPSEHKPWIVCRDDEREFCRYFEEEEARSITNVLNALPENHSHVKDT